MTFTGFFTPERDALLKQWREVEDLSIAQCRARFGNDAVSYGCVMKRAKIKGYKRPGYVMPKRHQKFWMEDENRAEELERMFKEGARFIDIAKKIGATPGMVSGKCHRLGLRREQAKKTKLIEESHNEKGCILGLISYPPPNCIDTASRSFPQIWDIGEHECHWPFGDPLGEGFRFCGASKSFMDPYCESHMGVAYNPQARKGRQKNV